MTTFSLQPPTLVASVLLVLVIATDCSRARAQNPPTPALPVPRQIVEAACGECQFGMTGNGCDLAIRIDGSTYFVDGTKSTIMAMHMPTTVCATKSEKRW